MRELVIGDIHFGIKTNSLSWLDSQTKLFKNQIFDIIEKEKLDRIVFLGDIFDIRYAINQQVGIEVKNIIRELCNKFQYPYEIIFVAGNHDYYSPLEEFDKYNAYELVFGPEFKKCYPNIRFITKEPYFDSIDGTLFLPWYWTENPEHFDDLLYRYKFGTEVKAVYCHADLTIWPGGRISSLKGIPVYSGHIHYLYDDEVGNLHNLGAALPLTFGDANQDRYLYIIEDHKIVKKIKNRTTPEFIRIYNEDIFSVDSTYFDNSYMQICVSSSNINKANYIDQIKYLKTTYTDANIRIHVVEDNEISPTFVAEGFNTNITQYIENNVPEHLNSKYEYIKSKLDKDD